MSFFKKPAVIVNTNHVTGDVDVSPEFDNLSQANHAAGLIASTPPNVLLDGSNNPDNDGRTYNYLAPNNPSHTQFDLNTATSMPVSDLK